jgi:hypothetical protein
MTLHDRRGLAVSTANPASLEGYEQALDLTASYFVDPLATINTALEADPRSPPEHCLRAALAVMSSGARRAAMLEKASRPSRRSADVPTSASACTRPRRRLARRRLRPLDATLRRYRR